MSYQPSIDILNRNVQAFEEGDTLKIVTQVIINYGTDDAGVVLSKEAHVTPNNGRVVEKTLTTIPDGTMAQTIANELLAKYRNDETHKASTISGTELTPLAELGDYVKANGIVTDIGALTTSFSKAMYSDIESQGIPEDDDFPYLSQGSVKSRDFDTLKAAITVNANSIEAEVTARRSADDALQDLVDDLGDEVDTKVAYTELSTKIGEYVDTSTGTAKIVSACSGTYLTQTSASDTYLSQTSASNTYTTITRTATLEQTVTADEAKIALVVSTSGGSNYVNTASIVAAVNDSGSSIAINADKLAVNATTTFASMLDTTGGVTTIKGGCITADTIALNNINCRGTLLAVKNGSGDTTYGYLGCGVGHDGQSETYGVCLIGDSNSANATHYVMPTDAGVRMQSNTNKFYISDTYTVFGSSAYGSLADRPAGTEGAIYFLV